MVGLSDSTLPAAEQASQFLQDCCRAMALCAETPETTELVAKLQDQLGAIVMRSFESSPLPVLDSLDLVVDMRLARRFQEFAREMPWKPSFRTSDHGQEVALLDFGEVLDLGERTVGLMYVDAGREYPEHSHEREELYFLLSGTADWRYGGHEHYQSISAGNLIYNHSWDLHGVRAGHTPLLALYLL